MFNNFFETFNRIFIQGKAYNLLLQGLEYTLIIALCAVVIGIALGTLLAVCKVLPRKGFFP